MAIWVDNIEELTKNNNTFRTVVRVGKYNELTLMSIEPGSEIGLEVHPDIDQFLRVESGQARVVAGPRRTTSPRATTLKTTGRSSSRRAPGTT